MTVLTTNAAGVALTKTSEGLRLTAYQDITGGWTIGYGHAGGVTPGETITQTEADQLFAQDLGCFETGVAALLTSAPSSNEFSAMVCLAYNIGLGRSSTSDAPGSGFRSSSVLKDHNDGNKAAAADAFLLWDKAHVNGILVEVAALKIRRTAERLLYLMPDASIPPPPTEVVLFSGTDASGKTVQIIERISPLLPTV